MGAKHGLAPLVAEAIYGLPEGPCLDTFAGMCSVAGSLSSTGRPVWCNDIQHYANIIAEVLVKSAAPPLIDEHAMRSLLSGFLLNMSALKERFSQELMEEEAALNSDSYIGYKSIEETWKHAANDFVIGEEIKSLHAVPNSFPYLLITLTYSHGYFGLRQAIELDSLKYAIDFAYSAGLITSEEARWYLVALLQTASRISTAPGHFAQYLHVKDQATYKNIRSNRKRSVWEIFLTSLETIRPYGTSRWRAANQVYCEEAVALAEMLRALETRPRIIYADPPYSEAQYSRFYHVLETIARYDYPSVKGKGRYREDRYLTPFSKPKLVKSAFENLIQSAAAIESDLVISYPSNGLLFQVGGDLITLLLYHYSSVELTRISHQHSTLGGRPGKKMQPVEENIFVARRPI
jgi:adenine-specific DNA-methyltransferase